jgi:hypothetical protein
MAANSDNCEFTVYQNAYGYLGGEIVNGRLSISSEIYGDADHPDSEIQYSLSAEDTIKLFSAVSLNEFIDICNQKRLLGMMLFLNDLGIEPRIIPVY